MSDQIRCQTCAEWDDPAEGCGCPERLRALLVSALADLAAERKAHAAAVVIEGEWRKMALHYQSEMEDIRAALSNGADDTLWPPGMTLAQAVELATLRAGETKPHRPCGYSLCGHPDCAHCFPDAVPGTVRYDDSDEDPKP
jgi:hypothetical protein